MLKLRTMYANTAHVPSHHVATSQITRCGEVLRKLKLDELPQLFNVLAGSMALVGPRPCLPTQSELIEARRVRGVLAFRPGVTGPAQLEGVDMSQPERLAQIEADYFTRASLVSNFGIMARTVLGRGSGDAAMKR